MNSDTKKISTLVTPLFPWAGEKTDILDKITAKFPSTMNHYYEIFVGGASVLLAFLHKIQTGEVTVCGKIHAYDWNEPLIHVYKNIQYYPETLWAVLTEIVLGVGPEQSLGAKESYFYEKRKIYNGLNAHDKCGLLGSALFIYLHKNGVPTSSLAVNGSSHEFHLPYKHNKQSNEIKKEHWFAFSRCIQPVVFECRDFTDSINLVKSGDFVYLDPPPFVPSNNLPFVETTRDKFTIAHHRHLFEKIHEWPREVKWLMSNSNTELVKSRFTGDDIQIEMATVGKKVQGQPTKLPITELLIYRLI